MNIRRCSRTSKLSVALFTLVLTACAARADLASAQQAYREGNYAAARHEFLNLAELGEAHAQFSLGAMALRGEGTPKDDGVAAGWMRAAAQNGYQGLEENKLQLMEAGLASKGQEAAAEIIAKYGREALLAAVLPAQPAFRCKRRYAPPRVQQMAKPVYPLGARTNRQDGIVIMQFTVGLDGLARDPEILGAAPPGKFDSVAIRAILQSRFIPATVNGVSIESRYNLRYTFMIREGGELWDVAAVQQLKAQVATGNPSSQYFVGLLGMLDPSLRIPEQEARQMLLSAAQGGFPAAQYWIGSHLRDEETYCTEANKTRPWLRQAANGQLATAQIAMARQLLASPDAASHGDEIGKLIHDAAQATDAYSVKHAVALLSIPMQEGLADRTAALAAAKNLERMDADYDPQVSEAIAAAYAANGDFTQARKHQENALATAEDLYWNTSAMQARLTAYEENRTWTGDLFALPPAISPLPEVDNPNRGCRKGDGKCVRRPDTRRTSTGGEQRLLGATARVAYAARDSAMSRPRLTGINTAAYLRQKFLLPGRRRP